MEDLPDELKVSMPLQVWWFKLTQLSLIEQEASQS
jgi:hypothetical protein